MGESARRIRARTRALDRIRHRSAFGDCSRQYSMAGGSAHSVAGAAAPGCLFAACAFQPERCATLLLPIRYPALGLDAVVYCRMALAGFSSSALSPIVSALAAASDRAGEFPLAAKGKDACASAFGAHWTRRLGRRSAYTNLRFAGDTGACRRSSARGILRDRRSRKARDEGHATTSCVSGRFSMWQ